MTDKEHRQPLVLPLVWKVPEMSAGVQEFPLSSGQSSMASFCLELQSLVKDKSQGHRVCCTTRDRILVGRVSAGTGELPRTEPGE